MGITSNNISNEGGLDELKVRLKCIRDFLRKLNPTIACFSHAAADVLHLYLNTKAWFIPLTYNTVTSLPLEESELGLELKEPLPNHVLQKSYSGQFILSCILSWINPMLDKPETMFSQLKRLIIQLPSLKNLFAVNSRHRISASYESIHRDALKDSISVDRFSALNPAVMKDKIFAFDQNVSELTLLGSPIMDFYLGRTSEQELKEIVSGLEEWSPEYTLLLNNTRASRT